MNPKDKYNNNPNLSGPLFDVHYLGVLLQDVGQKTIEQKRMNSKAKQSMLWHSECLTISKHCISRDLSLWRWWWQVHVDICNKLMTPIIRDITQKSICMGL